MDQGRGRTAQGRKLRGNSPHIGRGRKAEDLACRYLRAHGLVFLTANYRCRYGELDLVMRDGPALVIIEVRARRSDRSGAPEASLTAHKIRCLTRSARCFLRDNPRFGGMMLRFDVVGILIRDGRARIRWVRDALQFDGR